VLLCQLKNIAKSYTQRFGLAIIALKIFFDLIQLFSDLNFFISSRKFFAVTIIV